MIDVIKIWEPEVKRIIEQFNKAISQKNSDLAKQMILELIKLLSQNYKNSIRTSAAWAFIDISAKYGSSIKVAIPAIAALLDENDSFLVNYSINCLDNLIPHFPILVSQNLPGIIKALDNFDPGVRRAALSFFRKMAENEPNILKKNPDVISELKIATRDLDGMISSMAREIIGILDQEK